MLGCREARRAVLDDERRDSLAASAPSASVRARTTQKPPTDPCVMNAFVPLRTQPSPSRRAVVRSAAESLPLPGSVSAHAASQRRSRPRAGTCAFAPRCRTRGCAPSRGRCATRPSARSSRRPEQSPRRRSRRPACPFRSRRTPRGCGCRAAPCSRASGRAPSEIAPRDPSAARSARSRRARTRGRSGAGAGAARRSRSP